MFIGRIGVRQNPGFSIRLQQSVNRSVAAPAERSVRKNFDRVNLSSSKPTHQIIADDIYQKRPNRLTPLPEPEYTIEPDHPELREGIYPPSERGYTKEDALRNQYDKLHRQNIQFVKGEDGKWSFTGGVIFTPDPTDEDLEAIRQNLEKNGLGQDIDWYKVKNDMGWNDITTENVDKLDIKVDYLSSRYAVLKDRIEKQYTGEEKDQQMAMLNDFYNHGKDVIADSYAKSIGGFFEDLGQSGVAEDMKNSLLAAIDKRTSEYSEYIKETDGDYASIEDPKDKWLYQDDAYMAAQLRESMAASGHGSQNAQGGTKVTSDREHTNAAHADGEYTENHYSFNDLQFAGEYVREMEKQIDNYANSNFSGTDFDFGVDMAEQYNKIQDLASHYGVGSKLKHVIGNTFKPYLDNLMDAIEQRIEKNREGKWIYGVRYESLDREKVYEGFHKYF